MACRGWTLMAGVLFAAAAWPVAAGDALHARVAAAESAANGPACRAIDDFYWEIGDRDGRLIHGVGGRSPPAVDTPLPIASASKWLYAAYVMERRDGEPTAADIGALTLSNGYINWSGCGLRRTVGGCHERFLNDRLTPEAVGLFHYGGAPYQQHAAVDMGLAALDADGLATALREELGSDLDLAFRRPQPAGGAVMAAADYATFLRDILAGRLAIADHLGQPAVCTDTGPDDPDSGRRHCDTARTSPVDAAWHYGLGHWIEDDPASGDGAFSSAGAFGFYPWIDASRTYYGLIARRTLGPGGYRGSVACGQAIRRAWLTPTATGAAPR